MALAWKNGGSAASALILVLLLMNAASTSATDPDDRSIRLAPQLEPVNETDGNDDVISWERVFASQQADAEDALPSEGELPPAGESRTFVLEPTPSGMVEDPLALPSSQSFGSAANTPRANADVQSQPWIDGYQGRIDSNQPNRWWKPDDIESTTPMLPPWWDAGVREPFSTTGDSLHVDIASLTAGALRYSSFVRAVSANPGIQEAELVGETAAFDWKAFLETTYDDANTPVGSTLTTGNNASRYKNRTWDLEAGARRRNSLGGEVEVSQLLGYQRDNSRFLDPNPQRTTQLELQYTQPLLRGAGRAYNQSLTVLAQIELDQSGDTVAGELQDHLVKVTEAYWELYRGRAEFLQRKKLLGSARNILANLNARREIDAVERQIFRAESAVANRESEMLRVETRIRNWQSHLRLLVNDPALVQAGNREIMPIDSPLSSEISLSMSDSLNTALINRPDISKAIRDSHAASVRLGVAQKDMLPKLDLIASTYVSGLASAANTGRAYGNQFSEGRPTFAFGLEYEMPIGNRASRAQTQRRQWELNQAMSRFSLTVEEGLTSVEIAVREVETSYREMVAKHRAMVAAQREVDYLSDRWRVLPGANDSAAQLLENLLDAQERVADEEQAMVGAQVSYALTLIKLKSEMGTLLRVREQ